MGDGYQTVSSLLLGPSSEFGRPGVMMDLWYCLSLHIMSPRGQSYQSSSLHTCPRIPDGGILCWSLIVLWFVCYGIYVVFERHSQSTSFYGGSPGVLQGGNLYSSFQGRRMGLGLVLERSESGYVSRSLLSVVGLFTGFIWHAYPS